MSSPATCRKRIAESGLPVSGRAIACNDDIELRSYRWQQIPLGILHVNSEWEILEYRDRDELSDDSFFTNAPGKHLFSIAPWIRQPDFVASINEAIHSGAATSHFDFKVSVKSAEHDIHVNIFTLGDTTVWL